MGRPRTSKTSVARLFDQASFPIYLLDHRRRLTYCNAACLDWLALTDDSQVVGKLCNYHTDPMAEENRVVAGLCPPLEAFNNARSFGTVSSHQTPSPRDATFISLADDDGCIGVCVFVNDESVANRAGADSKTGPALHKQIMEIRGQLAQEFQIDYLIGNSPKTRRVVEQVRMAADGFSNVVIVGPEGSGRERIARTIHYAGKIHRDSELIPLSCDLLEAELLQTTIDTFVKRSSELASKEKNTLLLLEAENLPRDVQAELMGFLSIKELPIRIMATARQSLIELANETDRFRCDLAYAASTIQIELPRLVDRIEDLPVLAQFAVEQLNADGEKQISGISVEAMDALSAYHWPQNVVELMEMIRYAHKECDETTIGPAHLPKRIEYAQDAAKIPSPDLEAIELDQFLSDIEKELISRALKQAKSNKAKAAKLLGINRTRLLRRMEQLRITDD